MFYDAIKKVISDRTGCDPDSIHPESTFSELGIDSLDTVELMMNLEDILGFEIELDRPIATVQDLDSFLQSKRSAQ